MVNRYAFVEPTASKVTVAPSASADKFTNANKEFFATVGAASWVNFTNKTMISLHLYSNSRPSFEPVKPWNHKFYSDCYRRRATDSMWTHSKYMWSPHPSNPIEPMAPETVWSPANFPSYLIFVCPPRIQILYHKIAHMRRRLSSKKNMCIPHLFILTAK